MISLRNVATFLNLLVLFFLVIGRVEIESLDLKVGGKIENLFPLLLAAWFLERQSRSLPLARILSPFLAGMVLTAAALLTGCLREPNTEACEGLLRFFLQVGAGILLGAWLSENLKTQSSWAYIWIAGLVILQVGTPWRMTLSQPEMEGSFGHRNLQSAFYLLSLPLMVFVLHAHSGESRKERFIQGVCGLLLLSEAVFVIISQSRSGLAGFLVALLIWLWTKGWLKTPRIPRTLGGIALAAAVFIALVAVSPRFLSIGRELGNPYYLSRAGVWSAAIEGFHSPSRWLSGAGMGEGYFWSIQESPMGNLSYKYRRGHHPHCLYLQWIYWGGITALIGWLFILVSIHSQAFRKSLGWEASLLGACLLGYACLELFETAMKNPRVNALFWLDLTLLAAMAWRRRGEDTGAKDGTLAPALEIPLVALLLPLIWFPVFSFPDLLSLGGILAVILALQWPRLDGWVTAHGPWDLNLVQWRSIPPILITLFLIGLYLPLVEHFKIPPQLILCLFTLAVCGFLLDKYSVPGTEPRGPQTQSLWASSGRSTQILMVVAMGVPLLLGGFVMASFGIASGHLPSELRPREGLSSALWLTLAWWVIWTQVSARTTPRRGQNDSFSLKMAAVVLLLLMGLWGVRLLGTGWSYLNCGKDSAAIAGWDHVLAKSQGLGLPPVERTIRRKALEMAKENLGQETWIRWVKESDQSPIEKNSSPSPLAEVLACGGKFNAGLEGADPQKATGMAIQNDLSALWILYDKGLLLEITSRVKTYSLDPGASSFTHCRLDPQGRPLILRADGQLLRFEGTPSLLCPPPKQNTEPKFRRLCLDPNTGQPWSLDFYGCLHRFDLNTGWVPDSRFQEVSRQGEFTVDIARDIAVTRDGTLALLDCYGHVWTSPVGANTVEGPLYKTHYWPSLPLGQSIQALENGFILSDRHGGVYLTPYPEDPALLSLRGTYLFPRSLPREEPDIVDQAFIPGQRWVYLLTSSGRILTNHRWGEVWAE